MLDANFDSERANSKCSGVIKQGHVYENLMVNLQPSNVKLRDRMIRITSDITGYPYDGAEKLLEENGFEIRAAIEKVKK